MSERRVGYRIPFESIITSYVHDRTVRGLLSNISDTGINMSSISALAPQPGTVVGLEIDLPGLDESIWASGRICYRKRDNLTSGLGVKFVAMASSQARIVRDYCIEAVRLRKRSQNPRGAARGGVNGPALPLARDFQGSPVQRGRESPLGIEMRRTPFGAARQSWKISA